MSKLYVKSSFLLFVFCLSILTTFGQAADATLDGAEQRFAKGDYFGALYEYERAMKLDSMNVNVLFGYGKTLLALNNPKEASIYLKKARALDQKKVTIKEAGYLLAESYRLAGDYRNARKYYNYALNPYRDDRNGFMYKRIKASKEANTWATKQGETVNGNAESLGPIVNSTFAEYGAQIFNNKVYFSSLIADSIGAGNVVFDQDYYSKIFFTHLTDSSPKQVLSFSNRDELQFQNKHISNPSFLLHNLFFTACDTNYKCEIYRGKVKGNKIVQVKKLNKNINNTISNNTQPHVVVEKTDTIIYFVSDRDQGFGGLDIWRAKKEGFGFGEPVNVGNLVNSPDNEITPFFDVKSHQLFFSSNWHVGFGGYDIFKSEKQGIQFKTPENLGRPVNSSYHDYYFFPFENQALLSSNRPDGNTDGESSCCNDLFKVNYERELLKEEEKRDKLSVAETKVNEEELNKFLPLSLYFHNDSPKANNSENSTNSNFIELANQYIGLQSTYKREYVNKLPKEKRAIEEENLNDFFTEDVVGGKENLEKITPLLVKELEKGNEIELAVRGYASSLSSSEYNLKLAARRIQSLVNYFDLAEGGALKPYIKSGKLKINKLPLGDYAVSKVQDESDTLAAVYSSDAALERKIEIIALKSSNSAALNKTELPKLEISKDKFLAIYKPGTVVKRGFLLKNTGNDTLKVYQIVKDNELVRTSELKHIPKNSSERIIVEIFTSDLKGTSTIELLLITNDPTNHMRKIEVELRPID